ncbi:hypothetical protein O0L34_g13960 [Tuta absoluta]|nr:hypothetical protein O0L34_g13960 [Tuta absoluta]
MWYILLLVVAVSAFPKTDQEYKQEVTKRVIQCTKDHPVEMSELFSLEKMIPPKDYGTKCLLACAYRLHGSMTKTGLYDMNHVREMADMMSNGKETRKQNILKLGEICSKVNEVEVSDGEKGCERAAMIFKCVAENAPKVRHVV